MVPNSAALAIHRASFRAVRNLTYDGEDNVIQIEREGIYDSPERRGQSIEDQVQRGTGSGGWRALGSHL